MKFKVGDRVRVRYSEDIHICNKPLWDQLGYSRCETGRVSVVDPGDGYPYCVKLDIMRGDDDGKWWVEESELELIPSVPDGWTPASEPPVMREDSGRTRNVHVLLKDGREWYGCHITSGWAVFKSDQSIAKITSDWRYADGCELAHPGEVIAWREIEPEPQPEPQPEPYYIEYIVMNAEGEETSGAHDFKTIKECAESAANNGPVAVYKKVAEITRGPLVVKMFQEE